MGRNCDINTRLVLSVLVQHSDLQLSLAQTEKNYFETKLKLERASGEKQALQQENRSLQGDRDDLRHKLRLSATENGQLRDRRVSPLEPVCDQRL